MSKDTTQGHLGSPLVYEVSNNGEQGVFFIEPFTRPSSRDGKPTLGIRFTANTDFGSVGHTWGNLGPYELDQWPQVLAGLSKDYLLGKLYMGRDREFDSKGTLERISRIEPEEGWGESEHIRSLNAHAAQACLLMLEENCYSNTPQELASEIEEVLLGELQFDTDEDSVDDLCDLIAEHRVDKTASQAQGFWRELWPALMKEVGAAETFQQTLSKEAKHLEALAQKRAESEARRSRPRP